MDKHKLKFKNGDVVNVDDFMGMSIDGTVDRDCWEDENTCLVLFAGCQRSVWVPVNCIEKQEG
jgi:hypothetical protein